MLNALSVAILFANAYSSPAELASPILEDDENDINSGKIKF